MWGDLDQLEADLYLAITNDWNFRGFSTLEYPVVISEVVTRLDRWGLLSLQGYLSHGPQEIIIIETTLT